MSNTSQEPHTNYFDMAAEHATLSHTTFCADLVSTLGGTQADYASLESEHNTLTLRIIPLHEFHEQARLIAAESGTHDRFLRELRRVMNATKQIELNRGIMACDQAWGEARIPLRLRAIAWGVFRDTSLQRLRCCFELWIGALLGRLNENSAGAQEGQTTVNGVNPQDETDDSI